MDQINPGASSAQAADEFAAPPHGLRLSAATGVDKPVTPVTFTWPELALEFATHTIGPKGGECFFSGTFTGKRHKGDEIATRAMFALDIEHNKATGEIPPPPQAVVARLRDRRLAGVVYTTWMNGHEGTFKDKSGATHTIQASDNIRYRVVMPMREEIHFSTGDKAAHKRECDIDKLAALHVAENLGLRGVVDESKCTVDGPLYTPRRAEGSPCYAKIVEGEPLDGKAIYAIVTPAYERARAEEKARAAKDEARFEAAHRELRRRPLIDIDDGPIARFNREHPLDEMLVACGYTRRGSTDHYRSPLQGTDSYATRTYGERWISLSDSDAAAGLGMASKSGNARCGDAFDIHCFFHHGGDRAAALAALRPGASYNGHGGGTPNDKTPSLASFIRAAMVMEVRNADGWPAKPTGAAGEAFRGRIWAEWLKAGGAANRADFDATADTLAGNEPAFPDDILADAKQNEEGVSPPPGGGGETHEDDGAARKRKPRFELIPWKDYTLAPEGEEWLVHDLLPKEGVAVIYGKWKSFKSFLALDLAAAIARRDRRLWAGRATRQGVVVYICCEGAGGMRKRIEAYRQIHGLKDLDFYVIAARPSLGVRAGDAGELIEAIRAAVGDDVPVLVIIDTLARTLAGKDENGEGMRNFVDNAEDVADNFRCLVLAVHHEGAGETDRMRGSTTLDAASVATWHVKKDGGGALGCTVTIQDAKDGESGETLRVTLQKVELGDRQMQSTLMVESVEFSAAAEDGTPAKKKPTPSLNAFMTSVNIAMDRSGIDAHLPDNGPRVKAVSIELVRTVYYDKRADLDQDSKRKVFRDQMKAAIERELLVSGTITGKPMLWYPGKR
ncbi:AAA family ATPase [Reyranella sp.]|uniref:AAA family ATPase n=1 Tax=Reyranella sp. TaxID=1929291 RepID=UPI003D0CDF1B